MDPLLIESAIANWLSTAAKHLFVRRIEQHAWPDFDLENSAGDRVLIDIKTRAPSAEGVKRLASRFESVADDTARFLLVTPDTPSAVQREFFQKSFAHLASRADWLTVKQLPERLGVDAPGPLDAPETWTALQTRALVKGLEAYRDAPIGAAPYENRSFGSESHSLARQFGFKAITALEASPEALEEKLGLGTRRENVTVVLSDLVNFSSLVTASRPDDLKEAMGRYYRRAREAVFSHDGMLDKFIGDAVLAVFGYPDGRSQAALNAIRFSRELVRIGDEILADWQAELNAVIASGTRVGIATGDIWPINIGEGGVEISLLGDTINLAARLEKNCSPGKFLMDNRSHTAAQRQDAAFVSGLKLQQLEISASEAKGQSFSVRAWTPE